MAGKVHPNGLGINLKPKKEKELVKWFLACLLFGKVKFIKSDKKLEQMKSLVVFYSMTGTTKKVAETIRKILKCDSEEILDMRPRKGVLGYLRSGKEAMLKNLCKIKEAKKNPALYDLTIIGTPVWSFNVSSPVRAYLHHNKEKFSRVAFFCTMGGSGGKNAFAEMEKICGKGPVALLELRAREVANNKLMAKVKAFASEIINS